MGEAFIVRRGGGFNPKGKRVINVFVQSSEPTPQNVGDIWIVTDEPITNVVFRPDDLSNPIHMQGIVKISDSEFKINIINSAEFFGFLDDYIVADYSKAVLLDEISPDKIKIWMNGYMEVFAKPGVVKYWDNNNQQWVYNKAFYWTGDEWIQFSANNYYPLFSYTTASGDRLFKYSPEGQQIWARSDSNAWGYSMVKDPQGNICLGKNQRQITKLDPEGNHIWTVQVNFPNVSVDNPTCYAIEVDSDGNIYAGFCDASKYVSYITKLDTNGNVIWTRTGFYGTGIYLVLGSDGYLYFSPQDNGIYKYDLDGKQIAHSDIPYMVRDMAADNHDNIYIISSQNGAIAQLDSNLNIIWSRTPVSGTVSTPKITCSQQYVYCAYATGGKVYFYKYNLSGQQIFSTTMQGSTITSNMTIDPDECIYIAISNNYKVFKLDSEFNIIWEAQPRSNATCAAIAVHPRLSVFPYLW